MVENVNENYNQKRNTELTFHFHNSKADIFKAINYRVKILLRSTFASTYKRRKMPRVNAERSFNAN
jgi:hypothetical protein